MRTALALLNTSRRLVPSSRRPLSLPWGTGAAYVGLLIVAHERFRSPRAISLILLADFLRCCLARWWVPPRTAGRGAGAPSTIWPARLRSSGPPRRELRGDRPACAPAGVGTALSKPGPPQRAPKPRQFGMSRSNNIAVPARSRTPVTVGPAVAAAGPPRRAEEPTQANGITFAISAGVLSCVFHLDRRRTDPPTGEEPRPRRRSSGRASTKARGSGDGRHPNRDHRLDGGDVLRRRVQCQRSLLFADESLGAGDLGTGARYALRASASGSVRSSGREGGMRLFSGAASGRASPLRGIGSLTTALSPNLGVAPMTVACSGGFGNGLLIVYLRLLIQSRVPEGVQGRASAPKRQPGLRAFAAAFLFSAGATASALRSTGPRDSGCWDRARPSPRQSPRGA